MNFFSRFDTFCKSSGKLNPKIGMKVGRTSDNFQGSMVCHLAINVIDYAKTLTRNVCLFGVFSSLSRIFHSFGDVIISGEGLQILTYARQLWPLSSESSLASNALPLAVDLSLPVLTTKFCRSCYSNT